ADAARALVDALGTDLRELATALDQIIASLPADAPVDVVAVTSQFRGIESRIHEFVDALLDRDRAHALRRLRALLSHGERPLVLELLVDEIAGPTRAATPGRRPRA